MTTSCLVDHIHDFVCDGCSVVVYLRDGTSLIFSQVGTCKLGGRPPFKRDTACIARLVASLPREGGEPIVFIELRRPSGRAALNAYGRHFPTMEERDAVHAARVDPLEHWSGYARREDRSRPRDRAARVLEPDLFGATC